MKRKTTFQLFYVAVSLLLLAGGASVCAKYLNTSPVAPAFRGVQTGKGVVEHGYYSPIRNKGKVARAAAVEADNWTKALPDSLMCMLLESDDATFNPAQAGMYTFNPETGLTRFLTTSNTSRVQGGMAYGDLRLLWTYKNNAAADNHVWYTRSYSVKKYASGTLNLSDQKYLSFNDDEDQSMIASSMAYDPETGAVFGCFHNKAGDGYEFARMDHKFVDNGRSKGIAIIDKPWQACGFTDKGQMYAILADGSIATVDKTTGATSTVKDLGLAGNDSYAGFLDTRDNLFYIYWSNREKGESVLYVIDINDGCSLHKAFTMPFYAKMGAMVSLHNPIKNGAPGLATGAEVSFDGASLEGKVKFTAPTQTIDGQELSGELNYTVAAAGKVIASGKCNAGDETEANFTLPEAGNYYVRVRLENAEGAGIWSQTTAGVWAGPDIPVAPANVKAEYDRENAKMNISWDGVEKGEHNGSVTSSDVKYTVKRYVNAGDAEIVAENIPELSLSETIEWPENISTVKYDVYATFEGASGVAASSNSVILGTILAPWSEDFSDKNSLDRFTVYNDGKTPSGTGNNTQNVWFRYEDNNTGNGSAQIYYTSAKNHYLVTPPIYMEPGKSYIFHAEASGFASSYEEKVEVLMGRGNAIEDLTTTLVPTTSVKAIASNPVVLFKEIQVEEAGEYYIGFHVNSAAYKRYLQLDNIEIEAPYSTYGPNVVTDLSLDGFRYDGSTDVTVSFKAPTLDMQGQKLTSMTKIEVERDGKIVKTFRNPTFGETYTFEDKCPSRGKYNYKVTAYNSFGGGKYVTGSVETGVDFGAKVTDVIITEPETGVINLKWTPATTDVKGREIDPSLIQYSVILNGLYYVGAEFHPNTTNELTFKAVNDGYQANCYCTIYSYTDAGYNLISTYRFDPESYAQSITIPVGTPYKMPIFENGQVAVNWGYDTAGGQWWGSWFPEWSVVNPSNTADLGIETPDGDGYAFAWPVAFNQNYGTEYAIFSGAKSNFYAGKVSIDDSELSAFSFQFYVQPDEEETPRDEYIFYPIVHSCYDGDTALSGAISTKDFTPGWHTLSVSLDKYRGQDIQPGIHVEFAGEYKQYNKYFLIDDIQIRQFADHDMMALDLDAPMLEPGEENELMAGFRNIGHEDTEEFVVELFRNNEKIAESDPMTLKAGEKGSALFTDTPGLFWETLQSYHFNIAYAKDQLNFNNKSEAVEVEVLESRLPAVRDLSGKEEEGSVILSWTSPEVAASMTDDCEKYVPFSINRAGRWSFIDGDGLGTYPIVGDQFPGFGEPSAFIVWENINEEERNFAHSGSKCFAAFPVDAVSDDDVNDDWLISPLLNGTAQTVSFWAFGNFGQAIWGNHVIEVLYSMGGKQPEDFVRVGEQITLDDKYTQYSFDVPEGAQYFAIRYVQSAVSAIFIDDITFAQFGNSAELEGFDIYCDGEKLNENLVTVPQFTHSDVAEGKHTYHVVAVYKEGSSDLSNKSMVMVSGIYDVLMADVNVYTTPGTIHINNANGPIRVMSTNGIVLYSNTAPSATEEVKVAAGIYMVTVNDRITKVIVK